MTTSAIKMYQQLPIASQPAARIWIYDAFCFTPWYSTALVKALQETGLSVRFLAASVAREPDYYQQHQVHVDPGPLRFDRIADRWPSMLRRMLRGLAVAGNSILLKRYLERHSAERPDLIHLQQLPFLNQGLTLDFQLIAAAQHYGIPVIHTVHNLLPHDSGAKCLSAYQRLYSSVDRLICHSPDVAENLVTKFFIPPQRISVVEHGPLFESPDERNNDQVIARRMLDIASDRPVILWQGVMAPYKGIDVLLKAWTLCTLQWNRLGIQPLLLIAGTGSADEAEQVRLSEANSRTIRADIRYIPTSELPLYYQSADILVYPYRSITTSGALLTGLTYRKPIIASDLPPFRPYLRHNENALLTSPGDVADLAAALLQLVRDIPQGTVSRTSPQKNLYQTLLAGASDNRARYRGWDEIAQKTHGIYRDLLGAK